MSFYTRIASKAQNVLRKFGNNSCTLIRYAYTVDPISGTADQEISASSPCVAMANDSVNTLEKASLADKSLQSFVIAAEDVAFEPKPLDVLNFGAVSWQVKECFPVNPTGSTAIVYNITAVKL
jgi:hypothetical protein